VDDHLSRRRGGGALFGGGVGDESRAFHQVVQPVIRAGDNALGKEHQGPDGVAENPDGGLQGFAVQAFAVNAEAPMRGSTQV